jgi:hypothetical protein
VDAEFGSDVGLKYFAFMKFGCRFLKADSTGAEQPQLYILGVPSYLQEAVAEDFLSIACTASSILSPLGTDHWLVSAPASCIDSVLAKHEETTSVSSFRVLSRRVSYQFPSELCCDGSRGA